MTSDRTTLLRLIALCLALAPLPGAFAYSETDLSTLSNTGSCAGCDLSGADLYEADLYRADLSGANLTDADLTAADLTLTDLSGTDLRGAVLEEANLSGANLTNVLLDQNALAGVVFDSERTRTTLGFKELKLGMNVVEIAQYCSITNIEGNGSDLANLITTRTEKLLGHCLDDADMPFAFDFSGRGSTGVLNSLEVGIAAYTKENHRKFIDLLEKKYKPMRSYSAADVAAFNKDRSPEGQSLDTIFANGQVTLSVVSRGTGLQLLLTYRAEDNGQRFLDRKGGPAPVDLAQLPAVATDLYKLVGNYSLTGIAAKGTSANHGRIDTAYLEIDAFENELAGELAISGTRMNGRFQITRVKKVSSRRLIVELEPVEGAIPDGKPLRMSIRFNEDGDSFTGKWTNWFRLQKAKSRRPDDFVGVRSQSFWQTVNEHNRIDMYHAYLRLHPGGIYTAVARDRIAALGGVVPTPSSPTVSAAAIVSADTPATASTTPVDPLVGIWHWQGGVFGNIDHCYIAVGMHPNGDLEAKAWETHRIDDLKGPFVSEFIEGSSIVGLRDLAIQKRLDKTYAWESTTEVPGVNEGAAGNIWVAPAMSGVLKIRTGAAGVNVEANNRVCRKITADPVSGAFRRVPTEEALALELPPELLEDFPSPFVTEGQQVASVLKATAATPATPSAATVTTTPVDPLVGIWRWRSNHTQWTDECFLAVGVTNDGTFEAKGWEVIRNDMVDPSERVIGLTQGRAIVGVRDIAIARITDQTYSWESDQSLRAFSGQIDTPNMMRRADMGGQLSVATETTSLYANSRVCRKSALVSKSSTYEKLSLEEALALELPPELLAGFPSPFQEGTQWSGDVVTGVTGQTQTTDAPEDSSESDRR